MTRTAPAFYPSSNKDRSTLAQGARVLTWQGLKGTIETINTTKSRKPFTVRHDVGHTGHYTRDQIRAEG